MGDYFGLDRVLSIILMIIPFTNWILGMATRCSEKCIVAGIIRFFFGFIIWIIELVLLIVKGCNPEVWRIINT